TVTLIPNGIHHPPIEDGRLLPNSVKKIKRPQGISFPEPLEPPPAEIISRFRSSFHSVLGLHNLTRRFATSRLTGSILASLTCFNDCADN
ncbi:hypothetical protein LC949_15405, partial [Enterococcus faecium]|nr:hypothetical protein [Enterococcus faecium]MCH3435294.1 hypothetical protein [Enterococcus faecium]MCH3483476.1 hypothetical protein [Enterococcus faecium]MCH3555042.1 hypothetical protein [Enterococcus faecium]MCH3566799.1 hypothetical protein [Enterococcus faecium]